MASISTDPRGLRRVLFIGADGKRKSLRLGRVPPKTARTIKTHVEALVAAALWGQSLDPETSAWVSSRDSVMAAKLAAVGLMSQGLRPEAQATALGDFLNRYIDGRTDIKPQTRINLKQAKRNLLLFFGKGKLIGDITPGDADEFRRNLRGRLSENTARRFCGRAKQFFRAALRKRLIRENPFADMKGCGLKANPSRVYFITLDEAQKVLDACPNAQWRLLFALSRFGGLRCPSEHLTLRWGDVDWERNRITIHSPKTEHHEGGESRQIPMFPELRPYLERVFEDAEPGTEHVITRYRKENANLRTPLQRIILRAGLKPWPKLFQNLRSTRETELAESYPIHVVCAWIGNSRAVATKHYLQVRDDDFDRAANAPPMVGGAKLAAHDGKTSAQTPSVDFRQPSPATPCCR